MSLPETIKQQKPHYPKNLQNYLSKLHDIEQQNQFYRDKILNLITNKSFSNAIKQERTLTKPISRKSGTQLSPNSNNSADSLDSSQELGGLSNFYDKYMMFNNESITENQTKQPTEEQLCEILTIIKNKNKKTSIELMIKILHEIVLSKQNDQSNHLLALTQSQISINSSLSQKKPQSDCFRNYDIRFSCYKERVRKNYSAVSKLQNLSSQVKQQETESQVNSVSKFVHERFIQFSVPYHIVEYFKYKNSLPFRRFLDRQPFSERRFIFKEFSLKGHTFPSYNLERKTAKVFCLVGPGVRAARPFMGQDLGSHSHSKTISNIVKNGYRCLEQYINDNLESFLKPTDTTNSASLNFPSGIDGVSYPCYYASRRQISGIKTPLFNCRNWMNDDELELFFVFIKKCYRIKYAQEWEQEKISQFFLLFGRIIKKLMEKDILMRNLQVLRGDDLINVPESRQSLRKFLKKGEPKMHKRHSRNRSRKEVQERVKVVKREVKGSRLKGKDEVYENKYHKYASSFRSNEQFEVGDN